MDKYMIKRSAFWPNIYKFKRSFFIASNMFSFYVGKIRTFIY